MTANAFAWIFCGRGAVRRIEMNKALVFPSILLLAAAIPSFGDVKDFVSPTDPNNVPPPSGALLDLAGNPLNFGAWTKYSVNFTAAFAITDLTLAFRNDPGWTLLDDVSVVDITHPSGNLLTNPGFEAGNLTGWTYDNVFGATNGGSVQTGTGCQGFGSAAHSGSFGWCDGATQAYDAIDQKFGTTIGDVYTVSFYQNVDDITGFSPANYQQVSTNGCVSTSSCAGGTDGNGVDTLVYVGSTIPSVPEPSAIILLGSCVLGLVPVLRRRIR